MTGAGAPDEVSLDMVETVLEFATKVGEKG
jgi:hypothetical protein